MLALVKLWRVMMTLLIMTKVRRLNFPATMESLNNLNSFFKLMNAIYLQNIYKNHDKISIFSKDIVINSISIH